jgi:hypothetical protein
VEVKCLENEAVCKRKRTDPAEHGEVNRGDNPHPASGRRLGAEAAGCFLPKLLPVYVRGLRQVLSYDPSRNLQETTVAALLRYRPWVVATDIERPSSERDTSITTAVDRSNIMLWTSEILQVARYPARGQADLCRP